MHAISTLAIFALVAGLSADDTIPATVTKDGKPAQTMQVPADWKFGPGASGRTNQLPASGHPHIQCWTVVGTVDQVVAGIAPLVMGEVTDFKPASNEDLTVAGAPAKRLIGSGTEADDGDPANAEVAVFTLAGSSWLLLSHGEGDSTAQARTTITTVQGTVAVAKYALARQGEAAGGDLLTAVGAEPP